MDDKDLLIQIIVDTHKGMVTVKEDISAMKVDVKDHIRRTVINESSIELFKKYLYMAHGALGFISLLALVVGIVSYFK